MLSSQAAVFVIDDDLSVRRLITRFLENSGFQVLSFASAEEFLNAGSRPPSGCVVVDLNMPGIDGLQLQERMRAEGSSLGFVFITGAGDITTTVQAMKAGAVDFLPKPLDMEELARSVSLAIERSRKLSTRAMELTSSRQRFASLTPREIDVLRLVVTGLLNKQVAAELGITEKTVKVHRGNVMRKLNAGSFAELVRLSESAGFGLSSAS